MGDCSELTEKERCIHIERWELYSHWTSYSLFTKETKNTVCGQFLLLFNLGSTRKARASYRWLHLQGICMVSKVEKHNIVFHSRLRYLEDIQLQKTHSPLSVIWCEYRIGHIHSSFKMQMWSTYIMHACEPKLGP